MMKSTACILPVRDLDATAAFYAQLGFSETGRYDSYMIMAQDEVEVHFAHNPGHIPQESDHALYIRTEAVDALDARVGKLGLKPAQIPGFRAVEDKPWGMRELHVLDIDGHLLRIGQFI